MSLKDNTGEGHRNPYSAIRSDQLADLRSILARHGQIQKVLGEAVQFRIVLDTNMALRDIMRLARRSGEGSARTSLLEIIESETIVVYAPPQLLEEVEEKIPLLARKKKIRSEKLWLHWNRYKTRLHILTPSPSALTDVKNVVDPDDVTFVALAHQIGAAGILSADNHITQMGGKRLTLDFVFSVRDYSRSAAIGITIRYGALNVGMISIGMLRAIGAAFVAISQGIKRLPPWAQWALVIGVTFILIHPASREKVMDYLRTFLTGIKAATPEVVNHLVEALMTAQEHTILAQQHLDKAVKLLED